MALLEQGRFAEGWAEHEWRWETPPFALLKQRFAKSLALGRLDPRGKTIYVQCEQGLGDTIQFARYLPMLADGGATIIVDCAARGGVADAIGSRRKSRDHDAGCAAAVRRVRPAAEPPETV
jgi:hypothetical protein